MLPRINDKSFMECTEEDLKLLIDNLDYRENEYIDYKKNFSFLEIPKEQKNERCKKINEFKNDVCSLANAEGGYLIFGISDENGCASELAGVEISNGDTDHFELDRRNDLASIQPKTPNISFHFVPLSNEKYVVILYVKRDSFAPYMYIEDQKNYKIYRRTGNEKNVMSYTELRNMFNESLSLEKEVNKVRSERIDYYSTLGKDGDERYKKFILVQFIPESFLNTSENENMYILQKKNNYSFYNIFSHFYCSNPVIPCVDGIRFVSDSQAYCHGEGYVYNNRIVEGYLGVGQYVNLKDKYPNGYLAWSAIWDHLCGLVHGYYKEFQNIVNDNRIFICLSIIGCKDIVTEAEAYHYPYIGRIDRNNIMCNPVCIENIADEDVSIILKKLYIEYVLAIGIKHNKELDAFLKEVYDV